MKKISVLSIILVLTLSLSACRFSGLDGDTLLSPPQMSAADSEILKAMETISSTYKLVYPKAGSYQTAVILYDITGDEKNEAICFYTIGSSKTVSFTVFERSSEKWTLRGQGDSSAAAVDRVNFSDLNGDGLKEIVIGWQFLMGEEKAIEIFGLGSSTQMSSLYSGMYNSFLSFDSSVVVISRNTGGKTASASLIGKKNDSVAILNTVSLNNSISSFISVQSGVLSDSRRAIYIDEQLESTMYTTEVLTIEPRGELARPSDTLSSKSMRTRAYTCVDINKDKRPDIPVEKAFPSYQRNDVSENLSYIEWYNYDGNELSLITNSYTSINEQFLIELPDEWIGNITVQRDAESERAIHFYYIGNKGLDPMFSVRVFSQQEFSDTMRNQGWQAASTSNENVYAFHSDATALPDAFKADIDRITDLLKLLS